MTAKSAPVGTAAMPRSAPPVTTLHIHPAKATRILLLVVVVILPCRGFFFHPDYEYYDEAPQSEDGTSLPPGVDERFCNSTGTKLLPTDCLWPCSNVSSCPEGTGFVSFEECELQPWQKAHGIVNGSSEDDGNSTTPSEDVLEDTGTACRSVCSEVIQIPQCCPGFFGPDCLRE